MIIINKYKDSYNYFSIFVKLCSYFEAFRIRIKQTVICVIPTLKAG